MKKTYLKQTRNKKKALHTRTKKNEPHEIESIAVPTIDGNDTDVIHHSIDQNKKMLQKTFKNSIDIVFHEFETAWGAEALVVFIRDLIKNDVLDRDIIHPLMRESNDSSIPESPSLKGIKNIFPVSNIVETKGMREVINGLLNGCVVFFFNGIHAALSIPLHGWEKRSIEEPLSEAVIRGPKEGFIESIDVNRSLLRRRIKSENLVFEEMILGRQTNTIINIVYISTIVNTGVLEELKKRLSSIDTDAILTEGYIEEYIEDSHISPISTIAYTQKPDILASKILEGRVGILCDGSPHVLTVPHLFIETLQTSEDYYIRPYIATILRIIRILALGISILLPAFYVALETYHQEMISSVLLITMAGANEGTPLPAYAEALLMTIAFEFLKESGTRLPRAIGSAISIVGALILGDAAVNAGIISADLIIVIAFTAVSNFIVSSLNEVITLYRLIFLSLAGFMGLYAITAGVFVMLIHACSLRSFGVPYLSTLAPIDGEGLKDFIIRFPLWSMTKRPKFITKRNTKRHSVRKERK